MARAYPGLIYPLPAFPGTSVDIEGMSRESLRRYLRLRLRVVDARLHSLARERDWLRETGRLAMGVPATEGVWDGLLEIDYLHAMREAILETMESL